MHSKLSTIESALQFRYFGDDRLYTDHEGRRVIVDVEGFGVMRLVHAVPPVLFIRSENIYSEFASEFENGSIVLANGSGEVFVQVLLGRNGNISGEVIEVDGDFEGSGWVLHSSNEFSIDDHHDFAPQPSEEFPVPFFRKVSGGGVRRIIAARGQKCILIYAFDIDDVSALKQCNFKVQNISKFRELQSTFPDESERTGTVASHLNAASFTVLIPVDNDGLILRKTYDRFHGRQRARVHVDGTFVGWWFDGGEDRQHRWHVIDFGIPSALTAGKSAVEITVDPPAGVALWSVSRIEVFALFSL
jgi:hypothetical protein